MKLLIILATLFIAAPASAGIDTGNNRTNGRVDTGNSRVIGSIDTGDNRVIGFIARTDDGGATSTG